MITITKFEKEEILKQFPKAHIMRTMKSDSGRHHYYCEETPAVIEFLKERRNKNVISK